MGVPAFDSNSLAFGFDGAAGVGTGALAMSAEARRWLFVKALGMIGVMSPVMEVI